MFLHFRRSGTRILHRTAALALVALLAACADPPAPAEPPAVDGYGQIEDGGHVIPAVPPSYIPPENRRTQVSYNGPEKPGTIVVDPHHKYLYFVEEGGTAQRYRIAVGKAGRDFRGSAYVGRKAEWPYWAPTKNMIRTMPEMYAELAGGMEPGPLNPLGARALYLYRGNRDTMYRIHGTGDYTSIGHATSAGCIRLYNHDILDLYERAESGQNVKVRTLTEAIELGGPLPEDPAPRTDDLVALAED